MNDIAITLSIIGLALVLFAWNPVPAVVVAIGASLALHITGVLTMSEALTGFGDPVVVLIAALLAIAVAVRRPGSALGRASSSCVSAAPTRPRCWSRSCSSPRSSVR